MKTRILATIVLVSTTSYGGAEKIPEGEEAAIKTIVGMSKAVVRKEHETSGFASRDAHAKAHGCVRAEVSVSDTLPTSLQTSVFQPGATYPSWVRFSNGSGKSQDDNEGDGRGMAVKMMNVPGEKILDGSKDAFTQDILMINHPTFFVKNAADYVEFFKATATGDPRGFFFPSFNPLSWRLREFLAANAIRQKKVEDPLAVRYWTMVPILHGSTPVKYSARPCSASGVYSGNGPNKLREAMSAHLKSESVCYELLAQVQGDADAMPVEDPTIEWSEKDSPFQKIATITIPKQEFSTEDQQTFCENLSMNPWHANKDHRPLGGVNRVRKVVYQTISDLRHELNQKTPEEPMPDQTFSDLSF